MTVRASLDARLASAAGYVRQGAYFADIGTDHALLPVFLLKKGVIDRAVATDIAPGPLENAADTVRAAGLSDRVRLLRTDGLTGLDALGLTDIAVCGMGGELIAAILSAAPFVRDAGIRLILQPMSRAAHLRTFLAQNGFAVTGETLSRAGGKLYTCLCCSFSGIPASLTAAEAELGKWNLTHRDQSPLFSDLLAERLRAARKQQAGRRAGGLNTDEIDRLIRELEDV